MSEHEQLQETITTAVVKALTIAQAREQQAREVDEGIAVPIFQGAAPPEESDKQYTEENRPPNFYGYVRCYKDTRGYRAKLARLKSKKPKGYVFSETELIPLQDEAEIGTFFRGIMMWRNEDGTPMEDTEKNLRSVLDLNFVRQGCWSKVGDDDNWQEAQKKALAGN
jgi:hypothetical protein